MLLLLLLCFRKTYSKNEEKNTLFSVAVIKKNVLISRSIVNSLYNNNNLSTIIYPVRHIAVLNQLIWGENWDR